MALETCLVGGRRFEIVDFDGPWPPEDRWVVAEVKWAAEEEKGGSNVQFASPGLMEFLGGMGLPIFLANAAAADLLRSTQTYGTATINLGHLGVWALHIILLVAHAGDRVRERDDLRDLQRP